MVKSHGGTLDGHLQNDIHCECPYKVYEEPQWITSVGAPFRYLSRQQQPPRSTQRGHTPAIKEGCARSLRISHTSRRAPLQPVSKTQVPCTPYRRPNRTGVYLPAAGRAAHKPDTCTPHSSPHPTISTTQNIRELLSGGVISTHTRIIVGWRYLDCHVHRGRHAVLQSGAFGGVGRIPVENRHFSV